jgi:predicted hotdog family 3-hydroxylacyl-ACP dehydratase
MTAAPPLLDRAGIAALIPHQGAMCLLAALISWDETRIACRGVPADAPDHPLQRSGRVSALAGVEYGLQAAALHGALAGAAPQPPGFLAALDDVVFHAATLAGDIVVTAERLLADPRGLVYGFALAAETGETLVSGRAVIVLPRGDTA